MVVKVSIGGGGGVCVCVLEKSCDKRLRDRWGCCGKTRHGGVELG